MQKGVIIPAYFEKILKDSPVSKGYTESAVTKSCYSQGGLQFHPLSIGEYQ